MDTIIYSNLTGLYEVVPCKLSEHFKFVEFLKTNVKLSHSNFNSQYYPDFGIYQNLKSLVDNVLEPARTQLQLPIIINSGYRSSFVNKKVGGVPTSQHCRGLAADITCVDNFALFNIIKNMDYDQLIVYGPLSRPRFLHVSYTNKQTNRNQIIYKP